LEEGAFLRDDCMVYRAAGKETTFPLAHASLRGTHNHENMMAAVTAASLMGCPAEGAQRALESFRGLPHRMEWVREIRGVEFINDSKGTNVGATVKSLQGFDRPVILIAGGKDKGGSYEPLRPWLKRRAKKLVLFGEAKEAMGAALAASAPTQVVETLEEALDVAHEASAPGDVVLFSPACSSFDMFKNFEERGDTFKALVSRL
jgi:UDP-N-acetylmuramoylalanine--D-glutamate ligase